MSVNMKAATKWVKGSAKGRFYVSRTEEHLSFTDGVAVVRVPAAMAWDMLKALPLPLPQEPGEYRYEYGRLETLPEGYGVGPIIAQHVESFGVTVEDTRLMQDMGKDGAARLLFMEGAYVALNTALYGLFDECATKRGIRKNAPVGFFSPAGEFVGMILPLLSDRVRLNPYLALAPANECAAD